MGGGGGGPGEHVTSGDHVTFCTPLHPRRGREIIFYGIVTHGKMFYIRFRQKIRCKTFWCDKRAERECVWNACSVVECGHDAARRVRALKKVSHRGIHVRDFSSIRGFSCYRRRLDSSARATLLNHVTRRSFYSRSATPLSSLLAPCLAEIKED